MELYSCLVTVIKTGAQGLNFKPRSPILQIKTLPYKTKTKTKNLNSKLKQTYISLHSTCILNKHSIIREIDR